MAGKSRRKRCIVYTESSGYTTVTGNPVSGPGTFINVTTTTIDTLSSITGTTPFEFIAPFSRYYSIQITFTCSFTSPGSVIVYLVLNGADQNIYSTSSSFLINGSVDVDYSQGIISCVLFLKSGDKLRFRGYAGVTDSQDVLKPKIFIQEIDPAGDRNL
jgi:hypothetical protein